MIYLDHAATSPLCPEALEAVRPFLNENFFNPSSLYTPARDARKAIKEARETVASCIGAVPEEIVFTSGGTEGDNWAVKGAALSAMTGPFPRRIVTQATEHHAVLLPCESLKALGFESVCLPVNRKGVLSPDALKQALKTRTLLVSVMTANNETGTLQPVCELAEIAHAAGALFHTDAVQAVGHIPLNMNIIPADLLTSSAHKFGGPRGTGFLYIRRGTHLPPLLEGGGQEMGLRSGTENTAAIIGMAATLKKRTDAMAEEMFHKEHLRGLLIDRLLRRGLEFVINSDDKHLPGLLNISFRDADGEMILHRLDLMGFQVSTGAACNSMSTEISHVIRAQGLPEKYAKGTIRVSFGPENTEDDAERLAEALGTIVVQPHQCACGKN
ncbi:MAG: cysteine desulfurase [Clostridia bacterium]|nr:cysteine desulfurase [Clostridia bacterium]